MTRYYVNVLKGDSESSIRSCTRPCSFKARNYSQVLSAYAQSVHGVCTVYTPDRKNHCVHANISLDNGGYVVVCVKRYVYGSEDVYA